MTKTVFTGGIGWNYTLESEDTSFGDLTRGNGPPYYWYSSVCGIAGAFSYSPNAAMVGDDELRAVSAAMERRGPDGSGIWRTQDRQVALAHRRLAIIDLSDAATQPMTSFNGRFVITFNGEIYNYRALRASLVESGYSFRTQSDTEVILALYETQGPSMVSKLRGMFAFAIWDNAERSLFLARDAFGIKPLYFSDSAGVFRFASQVKALRHFRGISSDPSPAGHAGFFLWGFVPEPYTMFRSIQSLPAGTTLLIDRAGRRDLTYFISINREIEGMGLSLAPANDVLAQHVDRILDDSLQHHFVSDVPVGVFLSAGMDSSTLAALSTRIQGNKLRAVTLGVRGFESTDYDETGIATEFARLYGIQHSCHWISKDHFADELDKIIVAMDQPSIDGVNTYFVAKAAASAGLRVAISGLGGDELLGGYPSFADVPRILRATRRAQGHPRLARAFRQALRPFLGRALSPKFASLFEFGSTWEGAYFLRRGLFMPWELPRVMDPDLAKEGLEELGPSFGVRAAPDVPRNPHLVVAGMELSCYMQSQLLRDSDWAGMAHSLEVRVPFVDVPTLRALEPLVAGRVRPNKQQILSSCIRNEKALEILTRPKTGFRLPIHKWLSETGMQAGKHRGLRGWAQFVYSRQCPTSPKSASRRAMVFRIGHLGDAVISMPAISKIRQIEDESSVMLLTNKSTANMVSAADVLGSLGWFDKITDYSTGGSRAERFISQWTALRKARNFRPLIVYSLSPQRTKWQRWRDRLIFKALVGAKTVLQPTEYPRVPGKPAAKAEWMRLMELVGPGGMNNFRLPISAEADFEASTALERGGLDWGQNRIIAIAPGSKMPAKIWPAERFTELGHRLLTTFPDVTLIVLGGKEDAAIGKELCAAWGQRSMNLAGKLSILGSASVLSRAFMYVGNDTGTMHLAGVVGLPCVAIFSARDISGLWLPYGRNHRILRADVPCAGCMLENCVAMKKRCLTDIGVDEVFEACIDQAASLQKLSAEPLAI